MADDMSSALNSIKSLLGDNADEKIQNVMNSLSGGSAFSDSGSGNSDSEETVSPNVLSDDSMQYILKMKDLINEMSHSNDARSNLLMSLKPYMRESRKQSIDNALRLLSISKMSGIFKGKL